MGFYEDHTPRRVEGFDGQTDQSRWQDEFYQVGRKKYHCLVIRFQLVFANPFR
jgi:hypothetical protein